MKTFCRLAAAVLSLAAFVGPAIGDPATALRVAAPVARDNLSVYFVRGNSAVGAAPLPLDEAVKGGKAKLRWHDNRPFTIENLSDQAVFVPFGTLLVGGLQDQVVSTSMLVPPHSGPIPLATFCVDPFRSSPRDSEDPTTFATADTLFPNRIASLGLLTQAANLAAAHNIRQTSVWWGIDSLRASLSRALGVAIEPPYRSHWQTTGYQDRISDPVLVDRQSPWTTSLPQALDNEALRASEKTFADSFDDAATDDEIVGAVFAINGAIEGAEIYQSHALFAAMWPKLLRSEAVAAIAAGNDGSQPAPTAQFAETFLAAAQAGTTREHRAGPLVRDSDGAIFAETRMRNGTWINRSFLSTAVPAASAASPEAALLAMLKTGTVGDRPVATLGDRDFVVLHRGDSGWSATIRMPPDDVLRQLQELIATGLATNVGGPGTHGSNIMAAAITLAFFALLFRLLVPRRAARRVLATRYSAGHARLAVAERRSVAPTVSWSVPSATPACVPRRSPRAACAMKTFAAQLLALAARLWRAYVAAYSACAGVARRLRTAWATWPPEGLVAAVARCLGPAWPGHFGPPSGRVPVPTRK